MKKLLVHLPGEASAASAIAGMLAAWASVTVFGDVSAAGNILLLA